MKGLRLMPYLVILFLTTPSYASLTSDEIEEEEGEEEEIVCEVTSPQRDYDASYA